ncbi:hypothetical protein QQS21_010716 [Conoideocrella luteorostrata]|uniref:J domain-containing protein n=1 Tax=Conoideocrella luteorostrata TaxID=1105319 RepID=A0AAJ0CGT2_9HYPO|nr:hypothetical protein QQS21_010716 [Conoideocrella luteorostrata]
MASLPPDPYKILGVSKDAQIPEIRSAHRKLVLKCHPDKVQDPTLKALKQDEFQKVQQAYELLSDDHERQRYDDKVKLRELQKQFQNKANISSPRSSPRYSGQDEVRGTEHRASPFKAGTTPPNTKYHYNRSSDEDLSRGARIYDAAPRSSRRDSKREVERDREREREARERERDRERERERDRESDRRRRQEDAIRREKEAAKEAKEARRAERRARDKQRDKDIKRDSEEKKRYGKPYIEPYEDEAPAAKSDKKKSSTGRKKLDEKRDRSSGREDTPTAVPVPPPAPTRSYTNKVDYASSYIQATRAKSGGPPLQRAATYHVRTVPAAPSPPPTQNAPFTTPDDDDARRSSAKPRRGSGDGPRLSRERSYRASSREVLDDTPIVNTTPPTRHAATFPKASPGNPAVSSSPPRTDLPRTNTMPTEPSYSRPITGLSRSQTFNAFGDTIDHPRGRDRSRMQPQMDVGSDSEDMYERRRDRKHRSSRRHHSPEQMRTENVSRYQVEGSRSRLHSSYSRRMDHDTVEPYTHYAYNVYQDSVRPSMPGRESGYGASTAAAKFPKVKTSKNYGYGDVQFSTYYDKTYDKPSHEGYPARA